MTVHDALRFRIVDVDTAEIILEQCVHSDGPVDLAGAYAQQLVDRLIAEGRTVIVEVRDPDGIITPPDQWVEIVRGTLGDIDVDLGALWIERNT